MMYRCGNARLGCFRDAAGPNAGSADTNVHARAIDHGANTLQIWIPAAAAGIVGVTDHVPERRPLAANLASHSHDNSSPILTMLNKGNSLAEFRPIRTRFDCRRWAGFRSIAHRERGHSQPRFAALRDLRGELLTDTRWVGTSLMAEGQGHREIDGLGKEPASYRAARLTSKRAGRII